MAPALLAMCGNPFHQRFCFETDSKLSRELGLIRTEVYAFIFGLFQNQAHSLAWLTVSLPPTLKELHAVLSCTLEIEL